MTSLPKLLAVQSAMSPTVHAQTIHKHTGRIVPLCGRIVTGSYALSRDRAKVTCLHCLRILPEAQCTTKPSR